MQKLNLQDKYFINFLSEKKDSSQYLVARANKVYKVLKVFEKRNNE